MAICICVNVWVYVDVFMKMYVSVLVYEYVYVSVLCVSGWATDGGTNNTQKYSILSSVYGYTYSCA